MSAIKQAGIGATSLLEQLSKILWKHALARGYKIKDYNTGETIHKSLEGYIVDIRVACDGREKEDVERSIHEVVKGLKPKASKNKQERAQGAIKYLNKGGVGSAEQLREIPEIFLMQVMEQLKGLRLVAYTGIFQPKDIFEPFDTPESVESARFDDSIFKNVPTFKRDEDNKMSLDEHLDIYAPVEQCMADHTEQKYTDDWAVLEPLCAKHIRLHFLLEFEQLRPKLKVLARKLSGEKDFIVKGMRECSQIYMDIPHEGFVLQAAAYAKVSECYHSWIKQYREQLETGPIPLESWLFQKACQAYTFTELTRNLQESMGFTFLLFRYGRLKDGCFKEDDTLLTLEGVEQKYKQLEAQYEALAGIEAGWIALLIALS